MWVSVFIMWMGGTQSVFSPNHIFYSFEDCEKFRVIQQTSLERTKPHAQSGVKGSVCVKVPKTKEI